MKKTMLLVVAVASLLAIASAQGSTARSSRDADPTTSDFVKPPPCSGWTYDQIHYFSSETACEVNAPHGRSCYFYTSC